VLRIVFRQSSVYFATLLLARAINFLALPIYARIFVPAQFANYELITVFAGLIGIVIVLEVSQGVARFWPEARDDEEKRGYASTALWFTVGAYSVFCLLCSFAAGPISSWLLDAADQKGLFRIALLSIWGNGICYLLQNQLRWQLQAKHYAISAIVVTALSQGIAVFLIVALELGLHGLFLGSFIGAAIGGALAYYFCRRSVVLKVDWSKLLTMLRFALPLAVSGLAVFAARYVDRFVIKELMTLHDVGLYSMAARFASIASVFLGGFQTALLPLVTTFRREARTPDDLARILRYFLAAVLAVIFGLAVFSREIMLLFAGQQYIDAHFLIPLLAAATLLSGMYVLAPGLWLTKRTTWMLWINLATLALAIALNLILIPVLGMLGAAMATMIAALGNFLAFFAGNQMTYQIPAEYRRILTGTSLCLVLSLVAAQWPPADAYALRIGLTVAGLPLLLATLVSPLEASRLLKAAMAEIRQRFGAT
jgi:O-antigen/teichoic acid export membrane protein